jgi:hypothetical protein
MIETKFFRVVDNDAAPALDRMIREGPAALAEDKRRSWTLFLMSVLIRSPHSLVEIRSVIHRFFRANLEELHQSDYAATRQPDDPESIYDFAMERTPELAEAYKVALPGMIDNDVVGQHIINMRWAMLNLSAAPHTLLTGDRPCMTSRGIADPACMLSLPVSPTHLFVAANDIALLRQLYAQPARDTVRNSNDCIIQVSRAERLWLHRSPAGLCRKEAPQGGRSDRTGRYSAQRRSISSRRPIVASLKTVIEQKEAVLAGNRVDESNLSGLKVV